MKVVRFLLDTAVLCALSLAVGVAIGTFTGWPLSLTAPLGAGVVIAALLVLDLGG